MILLGWLLIGLMVVIISIVIGLIAFHEALKAWFEKMIAWFSGFVIGIAVGIAIYYVVTTYLL